MFVVCNGAFKSGSTWLDRIARIMVKPHPIPNRFQNPGWVHPSVAPGHLASFLNSQDVAAVDYVSKNHLRASDQRTLLLAHEHVRVLNVTRDLRDVLVSAFHHDRREGRVDGNVADYWSGLGKKRIQHVIDHHRMWNTGHAQVFITSYEALQTSFDEQVRALASFLDIDEVDVQKVRAKTDFRKLRATSTTGGGSGDRFHRKGIVGDWKNTLSSEIAAEVVDLAASLHHPASEG